MKKIYTLGWKFFICLIVVFIQTNTKAYATHAQGGDLTYSCLGGNQYRLRLAFYRDCSGSGAPGNVTIDINSANCNQSLQATLYPIAGTGQDVTPICPTMLTVCNGGNNPGVQEWIYEGNVTLPQACTDWVFSFSLCCRNAAINTIVNPGGQNIYIESHLNNVAAPCNNSPTFSNIPVPFICAGQSYCFNHGAVDPDGDSLAYTLVAPATGPTTTVTYIAPYSPSQPLPSSPAVSFNPLNGDICMTPTQIIVTVMAVRVEEWRNGIMIGSVVRDIQMHTINCVNNLPYISGINGGTSYTASICAGSNLNFYINSFDLDAGQNVTMTWNGAIPTAGFTTTGGPLPTGTFSWTPTASDISNTPYCFTITVTDDACPYFGTQTFAFCITVTGFALNITSSPTNCGASNGSAAVIASGGNGPYSYTWSPSGGNNANANGLQAGNYSVSVTDLSGCISTASVTVAQGPSNATINTNVTDVQCFGGTNGNAVLNVTGGQQPYTYAWSNSSTGPSTGNVGAGTYTVSVTTANNCVSTATVTITQPASPLSAPAAVLGNVSCFAGNNGQADVSASGGTAPYSYSWNSSPAQSTATASSLPAGAYSVVVTDAHGCTSTSSVNITQPSALSQVASSTSVTCNGGANGSTSLALSGGTPPYNTVWNSSPVQYGPLANNLTAGTYSATVLDANGCSIVANATVTEPAPLSANISSSTNVSCNAGNNGTAAVLANGGTAPYNYSWNSTPAQYNPNAVSLTAGNYTVTVTDANGCATVSTVSIAQPAPVTITVLNGDTICPGQPVVIGASAGGGNGTYTYNWNNNLGNNSTYTVYPSAATTYTVSATDANGCSSAGASINIDVFQFSPVNLAVTGNTSLCAGTQTSISASVSGNTGSLTWAWTNQNWTSGGPFTVQPMSSTNYQVTVTNQCGVVVNATIPVVVHPLPVITLVPQTSSGCDVVPLTFADNDPANAGDFYTWDFGDGYTGTGSNIAHNYSSSGTFNVLVTLTTPFGCSSAESTTANITVYDSPIAQFSVNTPQVSELEPTIVFHDGCSPNTIGWQWDFGDNTSDNVPSPMHTYAAKGSYDARLIATSNGGCTDTTHMLVEVDPEFTIYIPNAFTPNGDGKNDLFYAYGNEITDFSMRIFDRWGNLVFVSTDIDTGWDGRANNGNDTAQEDVYIYKVSVVDLNGKSHRFTGSVTLLQ